MKGTQKLSLSKALAQEGRLAQGEPTTLSYTYEVASLHEAWRCLQGHPVEDELMALEGVLQLQGLAKETPLSSLVNLTCENEEKWRRIWEEEREQMQKAEAEAMAKMAQLQNAEGGHGGSVPPSRPLTGSAGSATGHGGDWLGSDRWMAGVKQCAKCQIRQYSS
ncbi:unnamed protein product [Durusdinium trenchii]|uniref:Uncharacterized protein n=1 Tax=Durusdinium trenchii TaxID=1381693 RepID=A0ABP0PW90_9DINO